MADSSLTVRDVFGLPKSGANQGTDGWKSFQEKIGREVKGINTPAMPDLAQKVAELFEIPVPDIFFTAWTKANVLRELLEESAKSPETLMTLELGEHTINSQHRPHIEVKFHNMPVTKLEFTLRLVFKLKGFVLKIQSGEIKEIATGSCETRGTLEYQGMVVAEKQLAPIDLPGSISVERLSRGLKTEASGTKGVLTEAAKTAAS